MSLPVSMTRYMPLGGVPTETRMKYSPLPKLKPEMTGAWKSCDGTFVCRSWELLVETPFTIWLIRAWMEATRKLSLKMVSWIRSARVLLLNRNGDEGASLCEIMAWIVPTPLASSFRMVGCFSLTGFTWRQEFIGVARRPISSWSVLRWIISSKLWRQLEINCELHWHCSNTLSSTSFQQQALFNSPIAQTLRLGYKLMAYKDEKVAILSVSWQPQPSLIFS